MDVLPRPASRVTLAKVDGDETTTYINANFVRGYNGNKQQ
jgi:hypothetical protein